MRHIQRHITIFFLQFQEVLEDRGRIVVWSILAAVSPLVYILFWQGTNGAAGWTREEIQSYYLLAIFMYASVMSHQEEHIAIVDIQEGALTAYLLKPYSYIRLLFYNEISYRTIQGALAVLCLLCISFLFPHLITVTNQLDIFLFSCVILVCAFFLTFIFKTVIGLLAFWTTEMRGIFEPVTFILVIFSGMLIPLAFFPDWLAKITSFLPFASMIYFPVLAFEGKLAMPQLWSVLGVQIAWIIALYGVYRLLWWAGLKQYTAVGQ